MQSTHIININERHNVKHDQRWTKYKKNNPVINLIILDSLRFHNAEIREHPRTTTVESAVLMCTYFVIYLFSLYNLLCAHSLQAWCFICSQSLVAKNFFKAIFRSENCDIKLVRFVALRCCCQLQSWKKEAVKEKMGRKWRETFDLFSFWLKH